VPSLLSPAAIPRARGENAEDLESAQLVAAFQAGDRNAFAEIYMRYFSRVYAYFKVVFGGDHEAEDATQQVFVRVLAALPRFERRDDKPFRAWLFVIVRNHALSELKKAGRIELMETADVEDRLAPPACGDEGPPSLDWISDDELLRFVERLPLVQRQVIMLRFMLDLETREIARILERTPEDVRTMQHRALRFLETRLRALAQRNTRRAVAA
jgi:RNA polymerase sigma-70 factor (ECF subfamily)